MPMKSTATAVAGEVHAIPFVGPVGPTASIRVDVSALAGTGAVDAYGYIKPGFPLARTGIPVGVAPAFVFGVVVEAVRVHTDNTTLGAVTNDIDVAVATQCNVNRALVESNLGRALTADELAGFDRAGSKVVLQF